MRKIIIILVLVLTVGLSSAAAQIFKAEFSLSPYKPEDPLYKDIYGNGSFMFGVSLSLNLIWRIEFRAEANYFRDKGAMTVSGEEVVFTFVPVFVGARIRIISINKFTPYVGFGYAVYSSYREKLPERFGDVSASAKKGYHLETGVYVNLPRRFYLDVNIRKIDLKVEPFGDTRQLGGFKGGIGFGLRF